MAKRKESPYGGMDNRRIHHHGRWPGLHTQGIPAHRTDNPTPMHNPCIGMRDPGGWVCGVYAGLDDPRPCESFPSLFVRLTRTS